MGPGDANGHVSRRAPATPVLGSEPGSEEIYSSCPRLSRPIYRSLFRQSSSVYGSLPRQSSSVYGSWPRQSSPVNCSCPGHILYSRMLCEGSPLLFYTPWGPVTPMGMYRRAPRLSQPRRADRRGSPIASVLDYLVQSVAPGLDNLALPPSYQGISRPGRDPGGAEI